MCAVLSSMSHKNGFCFATNEALTEALGSTESSVKHTLSQLEKANVISITNKKTKKAGNRQIRLIFAERIEEMGAAQEEQTQMPRDEIADAFDRFYEVYPRKRDKGPALKMFRSKKLQNRIGDLIRATKNYASSVADTDKQFIKLPATFLNNQVWEEYLMAEEECKKISNAAVDRDPVFDAFYERCYKFAIDMDGLPYPIKQPIYETGEYERDGVRWFSMEDKVAIDVFGGLRILAIEAFNSDFREKLITAWNLARGGSM